MIFDPVKRPTGANSQGNPVSGSEMKSLCQMRSLRSVNFENSPITDAQVKDFHGHPKLEVLWLDGTKITDNIIEHLLKMPRLRVLRIAKTRITFDGLLKLAVNRRLSVNADEQFSDKQIAEFEKLQSELVHRKKTGKPPRAADDADVLPARTVLLAFFKEMNAWERRVGKLRDPFTPANEALWQAIITKYCVPAKRHLGSISKPPKHDELTETGVELETKNKLWFHFLDHNKSRVRYLLTRKAGGWLVEKKQWFCSGWSQSFL